MLFLQIQGNNQDIWGQLPAAYAKGGLLPYATLQNSLEFAQTLPINLDVTQIPDFSFGDAISHGLRVISFSDQGHWHNRFNSVSTPQMRCTLDQVSADGAQLGVMNAFSWPLTWFSDVINTSHLRERIDQCTTDSVRPTLVAVNHAETANLPIIAAQINAATPLPSASHSINNTAIPPPAPPTVQIPFKCVIPVNPVRQGGPPYAPPQPAHRKLLLSHILPPSPPYIAPMPKDFVACPLTVVSEVFSVIKGLTKEEKTRYKEFLAAGYIDSSGETLSHEVRLLTASDKIQSVIESVFSAIQNANSSG